MQGGGGNLRGATAFRGNYNLGNLNSKPSAGHKYRKLVGHFLDPVSGGEPCREAVAGAFYPHGVQRCTFVFANPQITSPSMTRLKPPSFDAYIYIYIYRPRFTRVVRGPTLVCVSLFSCVLFVKLPISFSEKCRAPVSIPLARSVRATHFAPS